MTYSRATSWLKSTLLYVNSIAELKTLNVSSANRNIVYLRGYYSLFDGGEGYLRFNPSNLSSDIDDGMFFAPSSNPSGSQGAWERIVNYDEPINLRWFGARGNANFYNAVDGKYYTDSTTATLATDDSAFLQRMRNYQMKYKKYECYVPRGNYLLSTLEHAALGSRWRHRFHLKGESSENTVFILSNTFRIGTGTNDLQGTGFTDPSVHAWRETIDLRGYGTHSNGATYNATTKQLTIKSNSVNFDPTKDYRNYWVIVRGEYGNKTAFAQAIIESGVNNGNGTYTFTLGKVLTDSYLVNPIEFWESPTRVVGYAIIDNGSTQTLTLFANQRLLNPDEGYSDYSEATGIPSWSIFRFALSYDLLVTSVDGTRGGYVHINTPDVRPIYDTAAVQRNIILDKSLGLLNNGEDLKIYIKPMLYIGLESINTNKFPTNPAKFKPGDWVILGLGSAPYDMDGHFETVITRINKVEGSFAFTDDYVRSISHPVSTYISRFRAVSQTVNTFNFTYQHNAMMRIEDSAPGYEPQFSLENIQFKRNESLPITTTAPFLEISQRRFFEVKNCRFQEIGLGLSAITDGLFENVISRRSNVPTFNTHVLGGSRWQRLTFKNCELVSRIPEREANERSVRGASVAACEIRAADLLFENCLIEGGSPGAINATVPGETFRGVLEFYNSSNVVFRNCQIRGFGFHFGVTEFNNCTVLPGSRIFSSNYEFDSIFDETFTGKLFTPVRPNAVTVNGVTDVCTDAGYVVERPEKIYEFSLKKESTLFSGGSPTQAIKLPARFGAFHYYKVEWEFELLQSGTFPYGCRFFVLGGIRSGQDVFDSNLDTNASISLQDNRRIAYYIVTSTASYRARRGYISNANANYFFQIQSFTNQTGFFNTVADIKFKLYGRDFSADL